MNNRSSIFLILCGVLLLGSCKKYLDVQPETSYTETQIYNNEAALQQAFNGLYLDLAQNALYGSYLSTTIVEMLAQRYIAVRDLQGTRDLSGFNYYYYQSSDTEKLLDTVWRKAYSTILATNVFLSKIDGSMSGRVISEPNGKLLKGEALAIRALIHFDMLRLFGPAYTLGSESQAIPYYDMADGKMQPLLSSRQVMEKVINDLTQALSLLANDPVITNGITDNRDFYTSARNQRMNYYAAKALLARAYLWQNNTGMAHSTALELLNECEKWFPWITPDAVDDGLRPDRIFYPEIIFGIHNPTLYIQNDLYFSPAQYEQALLRPFESRLLEVFEGLEQDYRFRNTWISGNGKDYRTFRKFESPGRTTNWDFIQPMFRKSELYLILAETESDPATALNYLNTTRRNRGLANLAAVPSLTEEIQKEYQKEFWGEGQLFYYYKRNNVEMIPSADYPYPWGMSYPVYQLPLPLSETSTR